MDPRKTAESINPMDYKEFFSNRGPKDPVELTLESERLIQASVVVVCGWVLIEAPLELGGLINFTSMLAVVASKVLTCLIGTAAIANLRFVRPLRATT